MVENFGFGDQAGIDGVTGYDCLHLEVWWNNGSYADYGYDISNVRLYRQETLPAGKYYFGATYPSGEANEDLYIFASSELLQTSDISTKSIAYEKVKMATPQGPFRGIFFTLEEETEVYLGWQADFTYANTNNLRASAVKLLYKGEATEINYTNADLSNRPDEIYTLQGIKINNIPDKGVYIIRRNGKTIKVIK